MNEAKTPDTDLSEARTQLQRRKRYKRLFYGILTVGIVGYFALVTVWNRVGGDAIAVSAVGVYWGAIVLGLGVLHFGPDGIEDEREEEINAEAAGRTLGVAGFLLILGAPGLATLGQTGVYTAPPWLNGMIWGYASLFGIFAVAHWYTKRQY
ncbi:Predicted membrane protein [Halovenus aranensis]|uniref:Predicted membrane protein n=1 Tax=Halovenus aranensis TaxID=890420 RepID=A0A1G8WZP4_9EURY|nr:DUF2178 domain-containing protein [Halovenus aranensis]SDJ83055.1 Predicted membrane protein [Halovenus aranensis]